VQEVERMSCARDCADCAFLFYFIFVVAGDGERLFVYCVVVGCKKRHSSIALKGCICSVWWWSR
jgi:hypothetical protein